jgi:hypothetical protein
MISATAPSMCWICGAKGDSGEHKAKRSDLKLEFGSVSQKAPLYLNDANNSNRAVGSLKSDHLKWPKFMCSQCNNALTQRYDDAWSQFLYKLKNRHPTLSPQDKFRTNKIFNYDTNRHMVDLQLYFVKAFGCVVQAAIDQGFDKIDTSDFAKSLVQRRANPTVYVRFGHIPDLAGTPTVSASDLYVTLDSAKDRCELALWTYNVNGVGALVAYIPDNDDWARRQHLWTPKHSTNRHVFANLGSSDINSLDF